MDSTEHHKVVAAALARLGYRVTEQFVDRAGVVLDPDHVTRIDLDGALADLIWDSHGWRIVTYPTLHNDELRSVLTLDPDETAELVARRAQPWLDEARRRWGRPETPRPVTFFGHWDGDRAVVDYSVLGHADDDREEDGEYPDGLWSAVGSGTTIEQAQADVVGELEADDRVMVQPTRDQELFTADLINRAGWLSNRRQRRQVGVAADMMAHALASAVRHRDRRVTWDRLARSVIAQMVDSVYGPGTAYEVDKLMAWWVSLTPQQREASGVGLPGETSMPPDVAEGEFAQNGEDGPRRTEPALNYLRVLLRDWAHHDDTALVSLTQDILQRSGWWSDGDHDAAAERRATFNREVEADDRAYDGWSAEPQKRALTARERDILTRILRDVLKTYTAYDRSDALAALLGGESRVMIDPGELELLRGVQFALNPRHD